MTPRANSAEPRAVHRPACRLLAVALAFLCRPSFAVDDAGSSCVALPRQPDAPTGGGDASANWKCPAHAQYSNASRGCVCEEGFEPGIGGMECMAVEQSTPDARREQQRAQRDEALVRQFRAFRADAEQRLRRLLARPRRPLSSAERTEAATLQQQLAEAALRQADLERRLRGVARHDAVKFARPSAAEYGQVALIADASTEISIEVSVLLVAGPAATAWAAIDMRRAQHAETRPAGPSVLRPLFAIGDSVDANWLGRGLWYPGTVSRLHADGTFDVHYADGESETQMQPGAARHAIPELFICLTLNARQGQDVWASSVEAQQYPMYTPSHIVCHSLAVPQQFALQETQEAAITFTTTYTLRARSVGAQRAEVWLETRPGHVRLVGGEDSLGFSAVRAYNMGQVSALFRARHFLRTTDLTRPELHTLLPPPASLASPAQPGQWRLVGGLQGEARTSGVTPRMSTDAAVAAMSAPAAHAAGQPSGPLPTLLSELDSEAAASSVPLLSLGSHSNHPVAALALLRSVLRRHGLTNVRQLRVSATIFYVHAYAAQLDAANGGAERRKDVVALAAEDRTLASLIALSARVGLDIAVICVPLRPRADGTASLGGLGLGSAAMPCPATRMRQRRLSQVGAVSRLRFLQSEQVSHAPRSARAP